MFGYTKELLPLKHPNGCTLLKELLGFIKIRKL